MRKEEQEEEDDEDDSYWGMDGIDVEEREDYSAEFLEEADGTGEEAEEAEREASAELEALQAASSRQSPEQTEESAEPEDATTFALSECCTDNKETLLRLLDHSKQILDECMRATAHRILQMELPLGMLTATEDLCQQQYGAYREMISQISTDQFSRKGTISVLNLVDRWRDDFLQRLAHIGSGEPDICSKPFVDG